MLVLDITTKIMMLTVMISNLPQFLLKNRKREIEKEKIEREDRTRVKARKRCWEAIQATFQRTNLHQTELN